MTYNIPTPLTALFPALCQALEREIHAKPLPRGALDERPEDDAHPLCARVTIGKHELELQRDALELLRGLSDPGRAKLFRLLPKILMACCVLARRDHEAGLGLEIGHFALCHVTHGERDSFRRLAKACGLDPDRPSHTARVELGIRILRLMGLKIGEEPTIAGLVHARFQQEFRHKQIDEGAHRGGTWFVAALHPALSDLMLHKFVQFDARALELKEWTFNVWASILGQRALAHGRTNKGVLTLRTWRLVRDGALSQTTCRGDARELEYLSRSLEQLRTGGFLDSWEFSTDRQKGYLRFEPPKLSQPPTSTSKPVAPTFGNSDGRPRISASQESSKSS